ncbi:MAG: hypothetical protein ACFFBD_08890 [Candidatus Hodarchaeota archaeon]
MLIRELNTQEFKTVKSIFKKLNYQVIIASVIEGTAPGRVWVDDINTQPVHLQLPRKYTHSLAGNPNNCLQYNA